MKKLLALFSLLFAFIFILSLKDNLETLLANLNQLKQQSSPQQENRRISKRLASMIETRLTTPTAIEVANELLESKKTEWKIQDYHELRPVETVLPLGTRIYYEVYQDGLKILNHGIQILVSKRGKILAVENHYEPLKKADLAHLKYSDIVARTKEKFEISDKELEREPVLYLVQGLDQPEIAYPLTVKSLKGPEKEILVRGKNAEILAESKGRKEF